MNLAQCETFVAVVDTGSFTGAAAARGVSQSAVSHSVSALEAELGIALMKRDRTGVELTAAGRRMFAHARSIVQHAHLMRQEAHALDRRTGTLRLGVPRLFDGTYLARLIIGFQAGFPGFDLRLREGREQHVASWLDHGEIDVAISTNGSAPLFEELFYAVVHDDHPLADEPTIRAPQLVAEPFITVSDTESAVRSALSREPTVAFRVAEVSTLLAMVGEGLGVALLPESVLGRLPDGVHAIPMAPTITRKLTIQCGTFATPAARALISVARNLAWHTRSHPARIA
ncbi:LysR family transcriptional regulator [Actinomadura rubrisoli]|uniref:LysR family transcriptional regulator n=1 Tax=Actinomadura rubrisoli TaxID=2530368 RepID=A0A4R5BBE6_9ACTN|nr:LysR family transcriptional regulator [Actinomadura rubrisoli]TDD82845.1 LysR family transcriptional regulator [Actinomadura rubrisoli]